MKRLLALLLLTALVAFAVTPVASSATLELSFNIAEARAYAYKISVTKEVIQAAGLDPCDKATDPYGCDKFRYEQALNCPPEQATTINPDPPAGATALSGGSGYQTQGTTGREPPKASPVKINELVTVGHLTRAGPVAEAGGVASDTFVDLDGRANPEAHTESDAFVSNRQPHEERCHDDGDAPGHVHVLSRSGKKPETYNLAECFEERCSRSGSTQGRPAARRAFSIVQIHEQGGKIFGKLKAFVSNMSFGSGVQSASVESVTTFVSFESDGTASGLKWSAVTTATGITAFGQTVALVPGQTIEAPANLAFIGISGPYVVSKNDGKQLLIVAPGLFYGTDQQTTYAAGAEVRAGFDRVEPFSFNASEFSSGTPALGLFRPGPGTFGETGQFSDISEILPPAPVLGEPPTLSVRELSMAPWPLASMITFGGFTLLVLLAGWIQRYGWAKRIFTLQPLRSINWMYRAFLRT